MKLFISIIAIIAAASAEHVLNSNLYTEAYVNQEVQNYANSAEAYQSALEGQHATQYYNHRPEPIVSNAQQEISHHNKPLAEKTARITSYNLDQNGHDYHYSYETETGIKAEEIGGDQGKGMQVRGAYSYVGDDGKTYVVSYVADENGFRPEGAHLPTPPPIPEAILKSLEQNARDEAAGISDEGSYREHTSQQEHQPIHAYQQSQQLEHAPELYYKH